MFLDHIMSKKNTRWLGLLAVKDKQAYCRSAAVI